MRQETISESTGYLIAQACKRHRKKAGELLSAIDLHVGQEMFLLQLWKRDGLTQSELADGLCVEPATITRMLDRMECSGLVQRRKDLEDQRVTRVYLTQTGRSLQEPVQDTWQALEEISMVDFSVEERLLLRRLLMQLVDNLTG